MSALHPYLQGAPPQAVPLTSPPPQPVVVQQPAYTQAPATIAQEPSDSPETDRPELRIYSHSNLYYWWPVWVVGYILALLSYVQGQPRQIGSFPELFHTNSGPGVIFFLTLFLVILITNVSVRGLASGMVIMVVLLTTVTLAYFGLWDNILAWAGKLSVHMNLGGYVIFSTLMFGAWFLAVFVFDRMSYWRIKPGQITHEVVFGTGSRSYDTNGMMVEKHRDDLFRHWVLGLGSGDLRIHTSGANRETLEVPNVLFVGAKIEALQRMIATEPDAFSKVTLR